MMTRLEKKLNTIDACNEAIAWSKSQRVSLQESWNKCHRGDWMLWLLYMSQSDQNKMVLVNCKIARTVLKYVPKDEERPLKAIKTTEAWIKLKCKGNVTGQVTLEDVKTARREVSTCSSFAAGALVSTVFYAAEAAYFATVDSYISYKTVNTAYASADYAACAFSAASLAAFSSATAKNACQRSYLNSAKIVREFFPNPPKFKGTR